MTKVLNFIAFSSIIVAFILLILFGFWEFYPYKVITFSDEYFPVVNKVVPQGGQLQFISNNCKYMDLPAKTSRSLIDDIIYFLPTEVTIMPKTGCNSIVITIDIASTIPPGEYRLQNIYEYQVNPIRQISIIKKTDIFVIVKLPIK
jgi:hypothetical protein